MSEIGVLWASAPTLEKLNRKLAELLAEQTADDVISISHSAAPVSTKRSGGIWSGGRNNQQLEYSAVVLVRAG